MHIVRGFHQNDVGAAKRPLELENGGRRIRDAYNAIFGQAGIARAFGD